MYRAFSYGAYVVNEESYCNNIASQLNALVKYYNKYFY